MIIKRGDMEHNENSCCSRHSHSNSLSMQKKWLISVIFVIPCLLLLRPFLAQQMFMRASSYFAYPLHDEAIRMYKKALFIDRNNAQGWSWLGYAYKSKGDADNAVLAYNHSLELDPNLKNSLSELGMLYLFKKDYKKALPYFERIRNMGPEAKDSIELDILNYHRSSLGMLRKCYSALGDTQKEKEILEEMKRYYPNERIK